MNKTSEVKWLRRSAFLPSVPLSSGELLCWGNGLCYAKLRSTVCVSGFWAGVDSLWEQENAEARKMLENAAESHTSGARFVGWRCLEIVIIIQWFAAP